MKLQVLATYTNDYFLHDNKLKDMFVLLGF